MNKLKAIDLFCGAGGLTVGLKKAGFKVLAGVEVWEPAINTYKITAVPLTFTSMPSDWDRLDHHEAGRLGVKPSSPVSQTN